MEQNETINDVELAEDKTISIAESTSETGVDAVLIELPEEKSESAESQKSEFSSVKESEEDTTKTFTGGKEEELYRKLKTELMDEIRKYFDPVLKGSRPFPDMMKQEESFQIEKEDSLINRIIDETGW